MEQAAQVVPGRIAPWYRRSPLLRCLYFAGLLVAFMVGARFAAMAFGIVPNDLATMHASFASTLLAVLPFVLAYWVLEAPDRVGLGVAFVVGIVADVAFGGLLGEQALRLVVMAFILQRFRTRLRFFPVAQQALAIGGLLLNDRVITAALHFVLGERQLPAPYWCAPAVGMVLWVPLFVLLDALRLERRT